MKRDVPKESPRQTVVDLRRWREERDRRQRAQAEPHEPAAALPPNRISWPFRLLALFGGFGFLSFGVFLGSLPWWIRARSGGGPWSLGGLSFGEIVIVLLGTGIALFGLDLLGRGLLAREWTAPLWTRLEAWLDRHARPLPIFLTVSALLLVPPLLGRGRAASWLPALYWFVGYLHVTLHELGHFLAVRRVRYKARLLVAGPLTLRWRRGRRTAAATQDWRWLCGGHVWFEARRRTRARDLTVLAAGPLANLLTLGAVMAVGRLLGANPLFDLYTRANLFCAALVLLVNLLPLPRTPEGYATDGRQILDLLRGRRIA